MKYIIGLSLLTLTLSGCGGDSGSSSSSGETQKTASNCQVVNNTIALADNASCTVSEADAATYNISAGLVRCYEGTINYAGTNISGGLTINNINFSCQATEPKQNDEA